MDLIKRIKRAHHPDWLIIEPSEMVVTKELRDVAAMGLRDTRYAVGPLIALVDGPDFDFIWEERHHLVQGKIDDADIVAVSRSDLVDGNKLEAILGTLNHRDTSVFPFSIQSKRDAEMMFNRIKRFEEEIK